MIASTCDPEAAAADVTVKNVAFTWKVKNVFTRCRKPGDLIKSPIIFDSWLLAVYPNGYAEEFKEYISIYVSNQSEVDVAAAVTISLVKRNGERSHNITVGSNAAFQKRRQYAMSSQKAAMRGVNRAFELDYVREPRNGVIDDEGAITFSCKIRSTAKNSCFALKNQESEIKRLNSIVTSTYFRLDELEFLSDSSSQLLEASNSENEDSFSDVTFVLGNCGRKISAHKCILASRNKVFKSMFERDMREARENEVEIADIEYPVFMELLRYIYASKVNDIEAVAYDLLVVADRYLIDSLKLKCQEVLSNQLTVDNALDYLVLSRRHSAWNLKFRAVQFAKDNASGIVDQPEFEELAQNYPKLATELTRQMVHSLLAKLSMSGAD